VYNASGTNSSMVNLSLDNRMVYLNLGMDAQFGKMGDGGDGDDGAGSRGQGGPSSLFSPHGYH
jgi:regulatory protein NPR1